MNSQPKNQSQEENKENKSQKTPKKTNTLLSFNSAIFLLLLAAVAFTIVYTSIPNILQKRASSLTTFTANSPQEQSASYKTPDQTNTDKNNPKKISAPTAQHNHPDSIAYLKTNAPRISAINQSLLATRISYLQLLNQQNPQTANAWLKLATQSVKQAQLPDQAENDLIETLSQLRSKIRDIPAINTSVITNDLNQLQQQINQLASPIQTETAQTNPTPEDAEKTFWSWKGSIQYINQVFINLYTWALSSIHIENINEAQYHTLQHTLGGNIFYNQATQLITQASTATTYQDGRGFQYACKQLEHLIHFYIQETKTQEMLIKKIQTIAKQPVEITPPDYLPLLQQLTQALENPHPTKTQNPPMLPTKKTPPSMKETVPTPAAKITAPFATDEHSPISYLHIQEMVT